MSFVLVWILVIAGPQGFALHDVQETIPPKFASHLECKDYAEATTERMQDWVRGRMNAPLSAPVRVSWRCNPEERSS